MEKVRSYTHGRKLNNCSNKLMNWNYQVKEERAQQEGHEEKKLLTSTEVRN